MFNKQISLKQGLSYYDKDYLNMINCLDKISYIMNLDRYEFTRELFHTEITDREQHLKYMFKRNTRKKNY